MTYEDYTARQAAIIAALAALLIVLVAPYRALVLTRAQWRTLLAIIYPHIDDARRRSAELAREFYDAERQRHTGSDERHPINLAPYRLGWLEEAMGPVRVEISRANATNGALARLVSVAAKEVENAGRRTQLWAVDDDPKAHGWARVAGGGESCAFCTMLISRGPVYEKAANAGLRADDVLAVELWRQIDNAQTPDQHAKAEAAFAALMTRWHPNCDCKVVPVFDRQNWPGRDDYLAARRLWKDTTRGNRGTDALNALRRALEGRSDPDDSEQLPAAA